MILKSLTRTTYSTIEL